MKSMTGMGRASGMVAGASLRIEIKSVNHRFCEISTRIPSRWNLVEIALRQYLRSRLSRGKIDVQIFEERGGVTSSSEESALKACYDYLNGIRKKLGIQQEVTLDQLLSGLGQWVSQELSPDEAWKEMLPLVESAVDELEKMRAGEGERLKKDIADRFRQIAQCKQIMANQVAAVEIDLKQKLQLRLQEKMADLKGSVDENRLAQEVVFYLDRLDVTEELQRLQGHLTLATDLLQAKEPIGRKMDFLLQEIHRELNTLSNKIQTSHVSHVAVDAKVELEKIREQIQNIE